MASFQYEYIKEEDWSEHSLQSGHNPHGDADHLWNAVMERLDAGGYREIMWIELLHHYPRGTNLPPLQLCAYVKFRE